MATFAVAVLFFVYCERPMGDEPDERVREVFRQAVERLRESSRAGDFALFEAYDLGDIAKASYRDLASRFDSSESTVTNRLASIRRQFRFIVLEVLRESAASDEEFRSDARRILGVEL